MKLKTPVCLICLNNGTISIIYVPIYILKNKVKKKKKKKLVQLMGSMKGDNKNIYKEAK